MSKPFTSLDQLTNGVEVIARFAKRDNEAGDAPDFGPWKKVTLFIQRREKDFKRGRQVYKAGEITTLTVNDFDWAEYSQGDYDPEFKTFLVEEYRMEIREVL